MSARCFTSSPVKDQNAGRQRANLHDGCRVRGIDSHQACWLQITALQTHHIIMAGRREEQCNPLPVRERWHSRECAYPTRTAAIGRQLRWPMS